uniref:Transmembrane protein n=1 Tax=Globodera rostochiensis TaxID=31243 RepID=A0A914HYU8_GLORO
MNELTRWTGLTLFEMDLHVIALFLTSVLVALNWHFLIPLTILQLFTPLFIASALNFFFLVIVFVRAVLEDGSPRRAIVGNAFHFFRTTMITLFKVFLCHKLQSDFEQGKQQQSVNLAYYIVMVPLWALLIALSVHACRLL